MKKKVVLSNNNFVSADISSIKNQLNVKSKKVITCGMITLSLLLFSGCAQLQEESNYFDTDINVGEKVYSFYELHYLEKDGQYLLCEEVVIDEELLVTYGFGPGLNLSTGKFDMGPGLMLGSSSVYGYIDVLNKQFVCLSDEAYDLGYNVIELSSCISMEEAKEHNYSIDSDELPSLTSGDLEQEKSK